MRPPGLDVRALAGLRAPGRDHGAIATRIEAHLEAHEGYVAFSGGKDSTVVLHQVLAVDRDVPVVFFDSGWEYPETYRHIDHLADAWSLNLHVVPATVDTVAALVATGAWDHRGARAAHVPDLHEALITGPAASAHAAHGAGELWGVRAAESRGRAATYARALSAAPCTCCAPCSAHQARAAHGGVIVRRNTTVAYCPIWDWKDAEVWGYTARNDLPVNAAYAKLTAAGAPEHFLRISHAIDATRLEHGRATWLRRGWPALFEQIAEQLPRLREFV